MTLEENLARELADIVKAHTSQLRADITAIQIGLAKQDGRVAAMEGGAAAAELKRQNDELKLQLDALKAQLQAVNKNAVVKLRSYGGGA